LDRGNGGAVRSGARPADRSAVHDLTGEVLMRQMSTRPRRPPEGRPVLRRGVVVTVAVAAAALVFLQALGVVLRGPRFVDRVSLANPGPYLVDVSVTDGRRSGWMGLMAVRPGERVDVRDVVDNGDVWV